MVQILVKIPENAPGGKPQEWAMLELHGSLETSGRFIGDLHFTLLSTISRNLNPESAPGGKPQEWAMIELQGSLETRHPVPLSGRFIGDLHFTHKDVPVLIIGHHILYGKTVTLEKPYGVMVKDTDVDETQGDTTSYNITAIIRKKLLFKTRPKPIIANVPKKL